MLNLYLTDYFQKKGITLNKWEIIKKTVSVCLLLSITFSIFINSDVVLALSQKVENINFGENINFYGVVQDSAIRLVTPTVGVEPTLLGAWRRQSQKHLWQHLLKRRCRHRLHQSFLLLRHHLLLMHHRNLLLRHFRRRYHSLCRIQLLLQHRIRIQLRRQRQLRPNSDSVSFTFTIGYGGTVKTGMFSYYGQNWHNDFFVVECFNWQCWSKGLLYIQRRSKTGC